MLASTPVIYLHTHDSGRVFSPYGYSVPSPHIAELAADALVFRQAYCASPTCSPSRAALLTGQYPHSSGMLGLANRGFGLADPSRHLVTTLRRNGYETALCGVQHEAGSYYDHQFGVRTLGYDHDLTVGQAMKSYPDPLQWDHDNASRAVEWIASRQSDDPFFLSFGQFATHRPYPAIDPAEAMADTLLPPVPTPDHPVTRRDYAGHVASVGSADRQIGRVLQALKDAGLYERSIIIMTTDHGLAMPGAKCTLSDAGTGVALIMRVPGSPARGLATDSLVSQVDVFPTLCDLLGIEPPEWLQGQSFARCFRGDWTAHRTAVFAEINFHTSYEPARSVRTARYKYIRYFDSEHLYPNLSNIDESPTKALLLEHGFASRPKPAEGLYDLWFDTGEQDNLAGDTVHAGVLEDLRRQLDDWQALTDDPLRHGPIRREAGWVVNQRSCRNPHSNDPADFEPALAAAAASLN